MAADYYLAPSLRQCPRDLGVIDPAFARRGSSDGWIGDASHAARPSDHNPDWGDGGVVRAIDVDVHAGVLAGLGMAVVAAAIAHPSTQYVIHDGYIWNRKYGPFRRRTYSGSNPHRHHVHISIRHTRSAETSTATWRGVLEKVEAQVDAEPGERTLRLTDPQMAGKDVRALQAWVGAKGDGWFGPATVAKLKGVQAQVGAAVDGVAGPETWGHYAAWVKWTAARAAQAKADAARKAAEAERAAAAGRPPLPKVGKFLPSVGLSRARNAPRFHGGVEKAQRNLALLGYYRPKSAGPGRFGDDTEAAVKALQRARGLKEDGVIGPATWPELEKWS